MTSGRRAAKTVKSEFWKKIEAYIGYEVEFVQLAKMLGHARFEMERRWYLGINVPDAISCYQIGEACKVDGRAFYLYICGNRFDKEVAAYARGDYSKNTTAVANS